MNNSNINSKKYLIISSTNKSLNLPLIPEGFVRKYAELQGKIDEVMIDMDTILKAGIEAINPFTELPDIIEGILWDKDAVLFKNSKTPYSIKSVIPINIRIKTDKNNYITITKVKDTWTRDEMCTNMQYYMEYCQMKGYTTPQNWLDNLKHF